MNTARRTTRAFTMVELLVTVSIIAIIAALAIPNLIEARKNSNEATAISSLKAIQTAQTMYQQADKDQNLDFGSLQQLSNTTMLDTVIGTGRRTGYDFACQPSVSTPEFLWFATANPALPRNTGDRYFCTNHRGVLYYTLTSSIPMNNTSCDVPPGTLQLVR
jgi:prepilin-type N-terminal cleavage/methylation domain-containing protein